MDGERDSVEPRGESSGHGGVTAALAVASGGTVAATPASDGSEPSVEAVKGRLDCGAGYEFWLARQALARNPAIKLYGLQWSAPAWVRDRNGGLWSRADVGYVLVWLRCARENGLTAGYIGGWNEHFQGTPIQRAWFVNLRAALDAAGFTRTQIVAADETPQMVRHGRMGYSPLLVWQTVAADMVTDPSFGRAVSVLGVHDTCGLPTTGYRCVMAATSRHLGTDRRRPRGHRQQSRIPVRTCWAGKPRILSGALPRLHRPLPLTPSGPNEPGTSPGAGQSRPGQTSPSRSCPAPGPHAPGPAPG